MGRTRKRVRIDSDRQPDKVNSQKSCWVFISCAKRHVKADDRISQLPDEILVDILSLLSINEAARTSILSSRWNNLWKHTPSLDFDFDQSLLDKFYYHDKLLESQTSKYVKWVNSVIQSHQSLTLKEFRIRFRLTRLSRDAITRWLEFAFSRQVERLELDINNYGCYSDLFCYPKEFIAPKSQPPSDSFKSLKSLIFKRVTVTDGAIDFFLQNCPLLEQLIVHESREISKPAACGSSLKLKHLELLGCPYLDSLKVVSAPRLTTLIVSGNLNGLLLEDVPMLVNVSVTIFGYSISVKRLFGVLLSCCISRLQTLRLGLYNLDNTSEEMDELPEMPKLKKLVVDYAAIGDESLVRLAALIRVSPYLEEFELKFSWYKLPREDREVNDAIIRSPHHHLKVFKFRGYYGGANDVELLGYILENCTILEKMIIDPYYLWSYNKLEVEESARKNAKQKLAPQVPQHVQLVIL